MSSNDSYVVVRIGMSYQEGSSWSAYEANDWAYTGGPHTDALEATTDTGDVDPKHAFNYRFKLNFGCQTKITGLFKTQVRVVHALVCFVLVDT